MIRKPRTCLTALALAFALSAHAQETPPQMTPEQQAMMEAHRVAGTPGPAHAGLARSAGAYDLKIRSWQAPGAPPTDDTGTATREMILDGRVMVETINANIMGQAYSGQGLHGYDNVTGKHWATWNDSMSTGLMVSEGSCDADNTCTFTGTHHDPLTKKPVSTRMVSRWTSPTVEVFEMYGPAPDGKEVKMMEITYTKRP
jgi:hypothetical protein